MTDRERYVALKAELCSLYARCAERGLLTKKEAERFVDVETEYDAVRDRLFPEPPLLFSHGEV